MRRMLVVCLALAAGLSARCGGAGSGQSPIHIAYAGDVSGGSETLGASFVPAIQLHLDELNAAGGINGRPVVLDLYDDRNDPDLAEENARKIVARPDTVAVIGHDGAASSRSASAVYERAGIVALSASPATLGVTDGAAWHLRTSYSGAAQASFLVAYIRSVLGSEALSVIHAEEPYGATVAGLLEGAAADAGFALAHRWAFSAGSERLEERLAAIADELASAEDVGIPVLAVQAAEGARLVALLRERGYEGTIVGSDALASGAFLADLQRRLGRGQDASGVLVVSSFLVDVGNERAQRFREAYVEANGANPDMWAMHGYDIAAVLAACLRKIGAAGDEVPIGAVRTRLRDELVALDGPERSVEGITGRTFFDQAGAAQKTLSMAVVRGDGLYAAPVQLRRLADGTTAGGDPTLDGDRLVRSGSHVFYRTDVVKVGVYLEAFGDLDVEQRTFHADLSFWFRSDPRIDIEAVEFLNAADSMSLGEPTDAWESATEAYRAYRVQGRLRMDPAPVGYGEHALAVTLRHRQLRESDMVFAIDAAGMVANIVAGASGASRARLVLDPTTGWSVRRTYFYVDVARAPSLGHPSFDGRVDKLIRYSRFNVGAIVGAHDLSPRGRLRGRPALGTLLASLVALALLLVVGRSAGSGSPARTLVLFASQLACAAALVLAGEAALGSWLQKAVGAQASQATSRVFDVLWWVLPAVFVNVAISRFVWRPLEARTGRGVPTILKYFVSTVVFLLASFGVIAFVFGQRLTSLLATGGVMAMIIGLAIQINITNIFSGIAMNLERPFKIGDWIMVHGRSPEAKASVIGRVVDIGWRTTRLLTADNSFVVIPNGVISEKTITNFMRPSESSRFELSFFLAPSVAPDEAIAVLQAGVEAALRAPGKGPSQEPPPDIRVKGVGEVGVEYVVEYTIVPSEVSPAKGRHVLAKSILEHLAKAGMESPPPVPRG